MRPARLRSPGTRCAALVAALAVLLLASGLAPSPASAAAVRDVRITQDGPVPAQLTLSAGDSVRFVNADTFVHRVVSDSANWSFDSRTLVPGESFTVTPALSRSGTYAYRGADLDSFRGSVVVPGTTASSAPASPSPQRSSAPAVPVPAPASPGASPASSPSPAGAPAEPSPSPAPVATGGSGTVQGPPPLAGGSFGGFVGPSPAVGGPAPLVADPFAVPLPSGPAAPLAPEVAPDVETAPDGTPATTALGDLPALGSPVEARRFGLPLALAAVLLTGVASLLVRLLLHEAPAPGRGPAPA